MKKTGKIIILLTMILAAGVLTSCNPDTAPDGKSAASKKQMTEAEFRQNSQAIKSLGVVEAYAVLNAGPEARSLSEDGLVYTFTGEEMISSSEIREKLEAISSSSENAQAKVFYTELAKALPGNFTAGVQKGSYVRFRLDDYGIRVVSSLDITIIIDEKTVEIEKDTDQKWIEIDGTFFDSTELEKMLDASEDAAEAIEELIANLSLDFSTVIKGDATKVELEIRDGKELEATISGYTAFKASDGKLTVTLDIKYTEFDDGKPDDEFSLKGSFSLDLDPKNFTDILNNLKNIVDVSISVNGMNVWADAFLAELD